MIGKTISHFTPWDKKVRLLGFYCPKAKKAGIRIPSSVLLNRVNKILDKLPSTEFIPSSSSGRRLNEFEGLRPSGAGGNPAVAGQALPTDRDKSSRVSLFQELSK